MNKIKFKCSLLFVMGCILWCQHAFAQQHPIFTQYMFNGLVINPAYAGSHESLTLNATARRQWAGFSGAPETEVLSAHTPIKFSRSSIGGLVIHDQVSVINQNTIAAVYSYRIPISEKGRLALGAQAGATFYRANYNDLDIVTQNGQTDPAFNGVDSRMLSNLGVGAYYHNERSYVGIAIPEILNNRYSYREQNLKAKQERHYFLSAGHVFDIGANLKLKPNVLLRWVEGGPFQYDLNANLLIKELVWLGVSYRMDDAVDVLFELNISKQLSVGYSYGYPISDLVTAQSGTHELLVCFRIKRNKDIMLSPRYF